jgi:hypothetical protein
MSLAAYNGGVARAANDVLIWGGDLEPGSFATSYIPTVAATVTRSAEGVPTWAVTIPIGPASAAVSVTTNYLPTAGTAIILPPASANPELMMRFNGGAPGCYSRTGGSDLAAGTWLNGQNRWACSTERVSILNGTQTTTTQALFTGATTVIGLGSSGGFAAAIDGIYSRICLDPSPTRCR